MEFFAQDQWWEMATGVPNLGGNGGYASDGTTVASPTGNSPDKPSGVRAIAAGGSGPSGTPDKVQYFNMATGGNAQDFGNLLQRQYLTSGTASRTRAVFMGGYTNSPSSGYINSIQCLEIDSTGSASDFGDLYSGTAAGYTGSLGNQIRGIRMGGTPGSQTTIDYVTIASKGGAKLFGNLSHTTNFSANINSSTRGVNAVSGAPNGSRTIAYVTIPSTGNAQDFGELSIGRGDGNGMSNSVRGLFNGGYYSPGLASYMEYVTIASKGDAVRFGDLSVIVFREGGHASPTRGVISGGMGPSPYPYVGDLQNIQFATEGNSVNFGDLQSSRIEHASTSNGHGGL